MPKNLKEVGHRQNCERWNCSAPRRSGFGARLQRRPVTETLSHQHRSPSTPTSRTLIFRRWRSFPSTTSDCPEWTSRSSRCALMSMARLRPTSWATSGSPDDTNKEEARKFTFYQERCGWEIQCRENKFDQVSEGQTGDPLSAA